MGRPKSNVQKRQLSIKMPAEDYQRLKEVVFHASAEANDVLGTDEANLSEWVRQQLVELMDNYESMIPNGRETVRKTYRDAVKVESERLLASLNDQ